MTAAGTTRRQAPLKVDPATEELISSGANFLGITKKDLVAEAVQLSAAGMKKGLRARSTTCGSPPAA